MAFISSNQRRVPPGSDYDDHTKQYDIDDSYMTEPIKRMPLALSTHLSQFSKYSPMGGTVCYLLQRALGVERESHLPGQVFRLIYGR